MRTICDRVYGEVVLGDVASRLLQTRWLARLDRIRQLGACSFVYPSATHTRLEHSIGVYHLAREMARQVQRQVAGVTEWDVELVALAGLLHDVGHGPCSHLFEAHVRASHPTWSHETQTIAILSAELMDVIADACADAESDRARDEAFLTALIVGDTTTDDFEQRYGRPAATHRCLLDIVHSPSGVDVDRMDYLVRDAMSVFGATHAIDAHRIVGAARVVDGALGFDRRVALSIQTMFELRMRMHKQVYQHREVLVAEHLLRAYAMPEASVVDDLDVYALCTDDLVGALAQRVPALRAHPRMHRVPVDLRVPTAPYCGVCGTETTHEARYCPRCAHPTADGRRSAQHLTSEDLTACARRALGGVDDLHVFVTDVTYGTAEVGRDGMTTYAALPRVDFYEGDVRVEVSDAGGPACRQYRAVYAFTESARPDLSPARVEAAIRSAWA